MSKRAVVIGAGFGGLAAAAVVEVERRHADPGVLERGALAHDGRVGPVARFPDRVGEERDARRLAPHRQERL